MSMMKLQPLSDLGNQAARCAFSSPTSIPLNAKEGKVYNNCTLSQIHLARRVRNSTPTYLKDLWWRPGRLTVYRFFTLAPESKAGTECATESKTAALAAAVHKTILNDPLIQFREASS